MTWTIDTGRTDGGIVTNGLTESGGIPTIVDMTRGEDVSITAGFWDESGLDPHIDRYKALRVYGDFAGSASVNLSITGQPTVTERIPSSAAVDSIIVDFVPGASVDHERGFWGVIQGVTDATRVPDDAARLELAVTILAEDTEYADRTALKNDIGGQLP